MKIRIDSIRGDRVTVIFYANHEFAGRIEVTKTMLLKFCLPFGVKPQFFPDWEGQLV